MISEEEKKKQEKQEAVEKNISNQQIDNILNFGKRRRNIRDEILNKPTTSVPTTIPTTKETIQTQNTETPQVATPTDNKAFIENATNPNGFVKSVTGESSFEEKNKEVITPKTTEKQGFNIPEPKREDFSYNYDTIIPLMTPPETEEERLAREKKERSSKNLSALFDGLTALSNIYHTTQYAPPQTLASGTEKMTQKYDKLRENADRIKKEYQNAILKLRQLDDADYQNAWNRWFALRKQYENGEISKQKMQQKWKQFEIELGLKKKGLDLKKEALDQDAKHHQDNLKEKAKDRAVQGAKNGENDSEVFASADKTRYVPKNKAKHFPWTQMYQAIVNTAKNHKQDGFQTIENGVSKNLEFKPLKGKQSDDDLTQAEIENAVRNYWGYSKEAIRILDNYLNENKTHKLYEDDNKLYD